MDNKTVLIKCICLAYVEKHYEQEVKSVNIINDILDSDINVKNDVSVDGELIQGLIHTTKWIIDYVGEIDAMAISQRLKLIIGSELHLLSIFEDVFSKKFEEHEVARYRSNLFNELVETQSLLQLRTVANNFRRESYKGNDLKALLDVANEVQQKIETLKTGRGTNPLDGWSILDTSDKESLQNALHRSMELISTEGTMRLGLQGLNDMLGVEQGTRRGNMYGIGALSHNGKSLSLKTWPLQCIRNNTPYLFDKARKPLAIYFSFEDSNEKTIQEQFKYMYEMKHQKAISVKEMVDNGEIDVDGMADFIKAEFESRGWEYRYIYGVGEKTTYIDVINVCEEYKRRGYEVIMVAVDYPDLMSRKFCTGDRDEQRTTSLIRNLRQYFEHNLITNFIAHQLSDKAMELARDGEDYLARDAAGKGMWKGCRTMSTELDVEIVQHIVRKPGMPDRMTFMRGKHRGLITPTPNEKKFVVYPFQEFGGLGEDLDNPRYLNKIVNSGGGAVDLDPEWNID